MFPNPNHKTWILWTTLFAATHGCDDKAATQIAREAADRQAQQNTEMARLNKEVASGSHQLVEADAKARKEIVGVHHDLQAERARLDTSRTELESERLRQEPPGGSIVNIASVHTHGALPASVTYDAAKYGMIGMTKSMAIELAPQGIRINAVSPGLVATQIWEDVKAAAPSRGECENYFFSNIPIGRPIEPTEIGDLVAFLLSDRSRCIVGSNIMADGGMSSQLLSRPPFEFKPIGAS